MGQVIKTLIVAGVTVWLALFLGSSFLSDPFGATTRREIQSRTAIETARLHSEAQIRSAEAAAEAKKVQAQEQRKSHQAWAGTMPILFAILAAGGALWLVIIYRGRTILILAERGVLDGANVPTLNMPLGLRLPDTAGREYPAQQADPDSILADDAARRNQYVHKQTGVYLLVDKQSNQIVQRLTPRQ